MPKSTKNNASKSTYPTRVPFRSKDTPINFGELYRNTQGEDDFKSGVMFEICNRFI